MADLLVEVVVSVVLLLIDDWSLLDVVPLAVPLAPMLDVLGLVELLAVPLEVLGLVELEVLGLVELLGVVELLYELLGVLLVVLWSALLLVDEAEVPPEPAAPPVPDEPLDCAIAKPPMASAAAAANVVSVFLVVVMSIAP